MTKKQFHDSMAVWFFNFSDGNFIGDMQANNYSTSIFGNFKLILEYFIESGLLMPTKIKFLRGALGGDTATDILDINVEAIMDCVVEEMQRKENSTNIGLFGITKIYEKDVCQDIFDIIRVWYDFRNGRLIIHLQADCWLPVDRDDNIQIEMAEKNAPILEKVLRSIKNIGYDDIMPDEGEEYCDELLPQMGFRVYLHDMLFDLIKKDLSETEIRRISKFLWSNRYDKEKSW
ncbi:MAG: hypothetical protein ACKV1O_01435 [Saprospiraceae bacterium]